MLIVFLLFFTYQQVTIESADAIVEAIPAEVLTIVATALVSAGVNYTSEEGLRGACQSFYDTASTDLKNYFNDIALQAKTAFIITSGLWQGMMSWKQSLLNGEVEEFQYEGEENQLISQVEAINSSTYYESYYKTRATIYSNGYIGTNILNVSFPYCYNTSKISYYGIDNGGTRRVIFYAQALSLLGDGGYKYYIKFYDQLNSVTYIWPGVSTWGSDSFREQDFDIIVTTTGQEISIYCEGDLIYQIPSTVVSDGGVTQCRVSYDVYSMASGTMNVPVSESISWDWGWTDDPEYDREGEVLIIPPAYLENIDNIIDGTAEDITYEQNIPDTGIDLDTGTEIGWLSNILTTLKNILSRLRDLISSLTNAIDKFFDLSQPINLAPLNMSAVTFTTKFPFSLPWDLLHSFTILGGTGVAPSWDINYMATTVSINFDFVDDWIPFIRFMELLIFDVGLIMATRRLLGGAV